MGDFDGRDSGRKAITAICLLLLFIGLVGIVNALKATDSVPPNGTDAGHESSASPDNAMQPATDPSH